MLLRSSLFIAVHSAVLFFFKIPSRLNGMAKVGLKKTTRLQNILNGKTDMLGRAAAAAGGSVARR